MTRVDQLWKCTLETYLTAPSISKNSGLLIYKTLLSDGIPFSVDLLRKCCHYCGSLYFPTITCSVHIESRKSLVKLKKKQKIVHAEDLIRSTRLESLPRCHNFVIYHCFSCNVKIAFRGSCLEQIKEHEIFLKERGTFKRKEMSVADKSKKQNLHKKIRNVSFNTSSTSYSLKDFLSAI